MAFSLFQKKDQLVTSGADESAEKYEFLNPIQSKSKTRRITALGATLTAVGILGSYAVATNSAPEQIVTVTQDIPRGSSNRRVPAGHDDVLTLRLRLCCTRSALRWWARRLPRHFLRPGTAQ